MEKHCESVKRFGKEGNGSKTKDELVRGLIQVSGETALGYARSLTGNSEDAKEIVQEAFYRAVRFWDSYDSERSLQGWFFAIVRNVVTDWHRRNERKRGVSLDAPIHGDEGACFRDTLPDDSQDPSQGLEREETVTTVRQAFKRLARNHRVVLKLCDMEGWRYDHIAQSLGIPVGTVRSRIFRARQAFRNQWSESAIA
jgi:RNA polymerase sigma-70 factor, ECF subfamily